ncbi:hypothetical protein BCR33DRAFT_826369 [Rhizoclosmatium globosum]|uniref:Uncharacterized protein n=1 Tax=Rhizoclosmatium globosum TaxID=329046 RepID=A0A1Y2C3F9_9FUNG|nr:hypothetical protein BCR33DRAFT_826369 [Rhizoclosmatium globosum]|eukprot:ORY41424.1 hypothetical protein BCR33DRAFT_826369 [Rhizoclosmatium globosum]
MDQVQIVKWLGPLEQPLKLQVKFNGAIYEYDVYHERENWKYQHVSKLSTLANEINAVIGHMPVLLRLVQVDNVPYNDTRQYCGPNHRKRHAKVPQHPQLTEPEQVANIPQTQEQPQVQQQLQNLPNEILPIAHNVSVLQCPPGQTTATAPFSTSYSFTTCYTSCPQSNNPQIQADILSNLEQPPNVQTDGLTQFQSHAGSSIYQGHNQQQQAVGQNVQNIQSSYYLPPQLQMVIWQSSTFNSPSLSISDFYQSSCLPNPSDILMNTPTQTASMPPIVDNAVNLGNYSDPGMKQITPSCGKTPFKTTFKVSAPTSITASTSINAPSAISAPSAVTSSSTVTATSALSITPEVTAPLLSSVPLLQSLLLLQSMHLLQSVPPLQSHPHLLSSPSALSITPEVTAPSAISMTPVISAPTSITAFYFNQCTFCNQCPPAVTSSSIVTDPLTSISALSTCTFTSNSQNITAATSAASFITFSQSILPSISAAATVHNKSTTGIVSDLDTDLAVATNEYSGDLSINNILSQERNTQEQGNLKRKSDFVVTLSPPSRKKTKISEKTAVYTKSFVIFTWGVEISFINCFITHYHECWKSQPTRSLEVILYPKQSVMKSLKRKAEMRLQEGEMRSEGLSPKVGDSETDEKSGSNQFSVTKKGTPKLKNNDNNIEIQPEVMSRASRRLQPPSSALVSSELSVTLQESDDTEAASSKELCLECGKFCPDNERCQGCQELHHIDHSNPYTLDTQGYKFLNPTSLTPPIVNIENPDTIIDNINKLGICQCLPLKLESNIWFIIGVISLQLLSLESPTVNQLLQTKPDIDYLKKTITLNQDPTLVTVEQDSMRITGLQFALPFKSTDEFIQEAQKLEHAQHLNPQHHWEKIREALNDCLLSTEQLAMSRVPDAQFRKSHLHSSGSVFLWGFGSLSYNQGGSHVQKLPNDAQEIIFDVETGKAIGKDWKYCLKHYLPLIGSDLLSEEDVSRFKIVSAFDDCTVGAYNFFHALAMHRGPKPHTNEIRGTFFTQVSYNYLPLTSEAQVKPIYAAQLIYGFTSRVYFFEYALSFESEGILDTFQVDEDKTRMIACIERFKAILNTRGILLLDREAFTVLLDDSCWENIRGVTEDKWKESMMQKPNKDGKPEAFGLSVVHDKEGKKDV